MRSRPRGSGRGREGWGGCGCGPGLGGEAVGGSAYLPAPRAARPADVPGAGGSRRGEAGRGAPRCGWVGVGECWAG